MKKSNIVLSAVLFSLGVLCLGSFALPAGASKQSRSNAQPAAAERRSSADTQAGKSRDSQRDADFPERSPNLGIDRETYLQLRERQINLMRGVGPGVSADPRQRLSAIQQLAMRETEISRTLKKGGALSPNSINVLNWLELGPKPLPNGETVDGSVTAVTGRATVVVVDPTNSNKVYLGTAQGGVWRSLDGGGTWTSIFDNADSLAIGALAVAPSNPSILYVGTGEAGARTVGTGDVFFGVGVYRIDNADGLTPTLVGPMNPPCPYTDVNPPNSLVTTPCFRGRAIRQILVDPDHSNTIFVSSAGAFSGISSLQLGSGSSRLLGLRGLFRSTNATTADANSVTFQKLKVTDDNSFDTAQTGNVAIWDMVFEPGSPNNLIATVPGTNSTAGIFRTTNALAADPATVSFTQTLTLNVGNDGKAIRLAINKVGSVVTVYATSNEGAADVVSPEPAFACGSAGEQGRLRRSVDGGVTWPTDANPAPGVGGILTAADGFCGGQCIYDNPVAVDPNNASIVYLGGSESNTTCSDALKRSGDGGLTFQPDHTGLHKNVHSIFIDALTATPSVWTATDGGIWKRQDVPGTPWINENKSPIGTIQFQSIAVHPTDRNFTIGGTQDNGTEAQQTTPGNWIGVESGDGGFALIDQSATDTTNVTMYHTFGNLQNVSIGFARNNLAACLATKDSWEFRGAGGSADATPSCDGTDRKILNGIGLGDSVNFYPPMTLGPGSPNVVYFGTDRVYRSTNKGDTMSVVSQSFSSPINTIGISPTDDSIRIVGLSGAVFATVSGSTTLSDITPSLPDNPNRDGTSAGQKYVSRAVIDPNNPTTAYITLSYYTPAGQGIFKTVNLGDAGTTWSAAATGIPSIPINAFAIDPLNSNQLFAGTDIGVYSSSDGGTTWAPYGTGLPRVAVFDMAIQSPNRILRVATHGRGMWEIPIADAQTFSIDDVTHNEGNAGTTSYTFTVTKTGSTGLSSSVNFTTQPGTATLADGDYSSNSGTLNFGPTDTSMQFTVLVNGDTKFEGDEAFTVHLSGAVGATISDADGTGTITNDDSAPTLAIDEVTHNEGNAGTTSYTFTVTKTGTSALGSSVNFTTQDGTATVADVDYALNSGSLSFNASDTTKQITVLVNGDTKFEGDDVFTVHLSGAVGATISDADGTGTITNDDSVPTLAIDDVTHNEGISGTTSYTFTVSKTGTSALSSSVNFTTQDGTATVADGDYALNSGSLSFNASDTTKQITVLVTGDTKFEATEAFTVHLSGASGATISDADGTGTITNDDAVPTLAIDDVSHSEGNAGTTSYTFTVTKTGSTDANATVDFTTQDGSATTADSDYQLNSGTLTFLPADTTKQITVLVNGDTKFEGSEAFTVHLSGVSGATLSDADGTGSITNDDTAPTLAIDDVSQSEGNAGTTAYTFTVTKTGSTGVNATVNFTTQDGSATTADSDYQLSSGSLTFLPADTSKQITVLVNGDTKFEGDEAFTVQLSGAIGATLSDGSGTGTVTNDDTAPTLAIDDVTHSEGNTGTTAYTFTVTKTGASGLNVSVNFTTQDGTATIADTDYQLNSGSLTFLPADTSKQITVLVNGDTKFEPNEAFTVHLSGASGSTISDADGIGTITDDDGAPTFVIDDVSHSEGNTGTTTYTFTVTKTGTTSLGSSVNFTTQDGTATIADNDYQLNSGTLNFLAADTTKQVTVLVNGDTNTEPNETFSVNLSSPINATIADNQGIGTIVNDDTTIQFSAANYNVGEGGVSATVTVNRSGDTSGAATVDFLTSDGTATQTQDYVVASGTLSFAAGDTSKTFSVLIVDDAYVEANKTLNVTLTNPAGAALAAPSTATVTIIDNDTAGSISPAPKRFAAFLDGSQETPGNSSLAKGTGLVLLNAGETSAAVGLQFQNLGSAQTLAHIHNGAVRVAGPIVFTLPNGSPSNTTISPTAQQVLDLKGNQNYMNVHSNNFPNGEIRGQLRWNPTLEENFFVRQQYLDFLSRDGDPGGFAFWVGTIAPCQAGTQCFHDQTIGAADAFFFEPEFQQTAGFVFRAYRAAFGDSQPFPNPDGSNATEANKLVDYSTFVADRARVVGGANLAQAQQDFANLFVSRTAFTTKYAAATTAAQFVDAILATIQSADSVDLTSQRQTLIDQYTNAGGGNAGRAMVVYRLADDNAQNPVNNQAFINAEYNRQFALTLYFGYLRRNPDISGFLFWQGQINLAPVRDVPKQNALVCSFITAAEYQFRFGPDAPRNNAECPQ